MGVRRKRFRSANMYGRKNQMRRYKGLDIKGDVVVVLKKTRRNNTTGALLPYI